METGNFLWNIADEAIKNYTLDELRKTSKSFEAIEDMCIILATLAENKISPDMQDGKHYNIDLQDAVKRFNNVFIEHGINPNLSIDWNLC